MAGKTAARPSHEDLGPSTSEATARTQILRRGELGVCEPQKGLWGCWVRTATCEGVSAIPSPRVFSSWTTSSDIFQRGLPSSSLSLSDPLLTVARVSFQICSCHFSAYKPSVAAHCLQDETLDECLKPNIQGSPAWACSLPSVTSHHKAAHDTPCALQHPALPGTGPPASGVCFYLSPVSMPPPPCCCLQHIPPSVHKSLCFACLPHVTEPQGPRLSHLCVHNTWHRPWHQVGTQ